MGQRIHGARIESVIGEGSAARVYLARHEVLDRTYAVKVLSLPNAQKQDLVERFYREARVLSRISHPNIVGVVDCGRIVDGRPFLTMELLVGETLQVRIARGDVDVYATSRQILRGLAEAHRRGLVHRDLKPANVMLVEQEGREVAKLLDFGIARLVSASAGPHITSGEMVLGTPRYMAPEQAMNASAASARSDLYSFGILLYEMLSGRAPFEGGMIDVLDQQLNKLPPALTTTSGLEPLVYQLLEKRPEHRPSSALAVLASLERIVERTVDARISFEGPTVLEAPRDPCDVDEPLVGTEPTVVRSRPAAPFRDTEETSAAHDTDPDPFQPALMHRETSEQPMATFRALERDSNPALWMLLALVIAFGATLAGNAAHPRIGAAIADVAR